MVFILFLSGTIKIADQRTSSPHARGFETPHEAFPHLSRLTLCIPIPSRQISLLNHAFTRSYGMEQEVLP